MRDRLIHGDFSVDLDLVWDVVDRKLESLGRSVRRLVEQTRASRAADEMPRL